MKRLIRTLLCWSVAASVCDVAAELTVIHAGKLLDVASLDVLERQSILVENGKVVAVEAGYREAPNAIDLKSAFVSPGWLDMHVHIAQEQAPGRYAERFTLDPQDNALRAVAYAERTLLAGFTTVRDLGTSNGLAQSIRKAIGAGSIVGPRIYTAGKSIATTGGHADPTNGRSRALGRDAGPDEGVINGVRDAYAAVRARYKEGADLIKITATGGVLSPAKSGDNPQFTEDEVKAVVAAARDYGFKVAAHAHGAAGMKRAVAAGVDSIEHGTYMTDEIMRLMRRKGAWYVPTVIAGKFVAEKAAIDGYFPEIIRPKALSIGPLIQDTFARAYRAGVPIAFGTDSGVSAHGDNWKEFLYMVEAGMPAYEAIQSATLNAAKLLGETETLGQIAPGMHADIVALSDDPSARVEAFGETVFVMKGGVVHKQ